MDERDEEDEDDNEEEDGALLPLTCEAPDLETDG